MTFHAKIAMPYLQQYTEYFSRIINVEDIIVFLGLKVFISDNFVMSSCSINAQVNLVAKLQLKLVS